MLLWGMETWYQWMEKDKLWTEGICFSLGEKGFFETFKYYNNILYFKNLHYKRFSKTLNIYQTQSGVDFLALLNDTEVFLCKLGLIEARVKIVFAPMEQGDFSIFMQLGKLPISHYASTMERLRLGVYDAAFLDSNSVIKYISRDFYAKAIRYAHLHHYDEVILCNASQHLIEGTISNLFYFKDGTVFTPLLTHEGIEGVMKSYLLQEAKGLGYTIIEKEVYIQDLESADEIFLTNVVRGIRPVATFMGIEKPIASTLQLIQQLFGHNTTSTYV